MKERILIVQASVAGTGSTFLSNALYGFMLPERSIDFRPYRPPHELTQSVTIIKTHSMRFEDFMCDAADVYFVCTERLQPVRSIPGRTLVVHYNDILESADNTLERIVDFTLRETEGVPTGPFRPATGQVPGPAQGNERRIRKDQRQTVFLFRSLLPAPRLPQGQVGRLTSGCYLPAAYRSRRSSSYPSNIGSRRSCTVKTVHWPSSDSTSICPP